MVLAKSNLGGSPALSPDGEKDAGGCPGYRNFYRKQQAKQLRSASGLIPGAFLFLLELIFNRCKNKDAHPFW